MQLPASALLKYSDDARITAFTSWPALAKMVQDDIGASVSVKAHLIRLLRPSKCHPTCTMGVKQTPHAIGSTTLTLAYEFFDDNTDEPFAQILAVCARMKNGETLPLPEYVAEGLVWRHRATELENTKDIVLLSSAIERTKVPTAVANNNRLVHQVLVRPSDTDFRKVVANHRIMQFFEDSMAGHKLPDVIYIEYLDELHANSRCDLFGVPNKETGGQEMVSFLIEQDIGSIIARTYVSWASKTLKDGK